jgi:hypothetical protein
VIATTNYAITPQTGSINWNALAWSLGHVPTCCESAYITYTGTNAGIDAVTVNITNDICIRNLTLSNAATSPTNKVFKTILAAGFNMQMNGYVRMTASGVLTTDSCIFIANGNNNIIVEGNTTIGYPSDNAHSIIGSSPSTIGTINYILKGDSLTFNAKGLTSSNFMNVKMIPNFDTAYLTNNSDASPFPEAVKFENLRLGDSVRATTFLVTGTNQNNFINDKSGLLEVKTNSTLILASNYTINNTGSTSALLNLNSNAILKVGGNAGGETGSNFPKNFTAYSLHPNSIVDYNATSSLTQTVFGGATYGKLILSKEVGTTRASKNSMAPITSATSITVNPLVDFTLGGTVSSNGSFNILGTAGLYCNANVVSGAGVFTLGDACYLGSGHAQGISSLGNATGNIQMTGGRTFTTTSNYLYNGNVPQINGNGLPSIAVNDLTIDNPTTVTIANNQLVNGVHLLKQGVFDIQANKIVINGVGTINAVTGKMKADQGIVEMKGTSGTAQNLSGNWFVNKTINILTNANTTGIRVAPVPADTLLIAEALDYNAVTGSIITTNDNLTLLSRLNKTANFGNATGNSIVGKVNVERYMFARSAWRLLATPIQIATSPTVSQAWRENNSAHSATGYGTRITGPSVSFSSNAGILDDYTINYSMKSYNAITNNFNPVVNANTITIANLNGYYVFVRGDRSAPATIGLSGITNLRIKGDLRTGNQVFNIPANKFESIGNPFASRVDMRTVNKTNISSSFYVWNPNNRGFYNVGSYETYLYNTTSGNYERVGDGSVRNFIESGEAIFVQSNTTTSAGSVTFKETDKGNGSANVSRPGVITPSLDLLLYAQNTDSSMYITDAIKMNFDNAYNIAIDNDDVRKINNTYDNIAIKKGATYLIVERRNNLQVTDTIQLNISGMRVANYRLDIDPSVLNYPGLEPIFVDKNLQTKTALSFTELTSIAFKITTDVGSKAADRFMIIFKAVPTVQLTNIAAARNLNKTVKVNWSVATEVNVENYTIEHSLDGINFVTIATETATINNGGNANYSMIHSNASEQKNWYRIRANSAFGAPKYSAIALVTEILKSTINPNASISIAQTIVTDGQVNVILTNQVEGKYTLVITNTIGQIIKQSQVNVDNDRFTYNLKTGTVPKGVYQLTVINTIGEKITLPFIVK